MVLRKASIKLLGCGGEKEVVEIVKDFFSLGRLLQKLNHTHVVLILKVAKPVSVTQFSLYHYAM